MKYNFAKATQTDTKNPDQHICKKLCLYLVYKFKQECQTDTKYALGICGKLNIQYLIFDLESRYHLFVFGQFKGHNSGGD